MAGQKEEGTEAKPYTTIANGIRNASSGQAVRVIAGTYTETLTMAFGDYEQLVNPHMAQFAFQPLMEHHAEG